MSTNRLARFVALLVAGMTAAAARQDGTVVPFGGATNLDWLVYRGDPKGNQYSSLAEIHAANVHRLERAWEYKARDGVVTYITPSTTIGFACNVDRSLASARFYDVGELTSLR
jgi:glucose dehydrogenase